MGSSDFLLVETDESDGSIVSYYPEIGILANISKDHKPLAELREVFGRFLANVKGTIIVNADCPFVKELSARFSPGNMVSFGLKGDGDICARDITLSESAATFTVNETRFRLPAPGIHNVSNALAGIALGTVFQIPFGAMREALETFQGVARRLEVVGSAGGIRVIDDYSHNPAKIAAALAAVRQRAGRVVLIYQPHGYGPTRFLKEELIETFNKCLTSEDFLILLDIYYAGGTVDASISAADLLEGVHVPRAEKAASRKGVARQVTDFVESGDDVVVMGARDPTLSDLARAIVTALSDEPLRQT
jgi:UDP-N-acetylmuramate--alanine ligase